MSDFSGKYFNEKIVSIKFLLIIDKKNKLLNIFRHNSKFFFYKTNLISILILLLTC